MIYILIGFIFGFSIPYLSRRFAKFMPATFAYALYDIFKINKKTSSIKRKSSLQYTNLHKKYVMRSFGWGVVLSALCYLLSICTLPTETPWLVFFILTLFLLYEIDKRMLLLPDLLTVPLLIIGFTYASFAGDLLGDDTTQSVANSSLGAIFGYFMPVISSLFLIRKSPDVFGGGDIKLLSAIGAWLGLGVVPFVILLSCIVFGITCFIKKERSGAFGPSIVISTIIMLFLLLA